MKICNLFYLKIILMMVFFELNTSIINAQNLVNNWSFEDSVSCPPGISSIDKSIGWTSFWSSPDYFHICNPSNSPFPNNNAGVPNNFFGYQYPRNGNSYAGFYCYSTTAFNAREIAGTELNQILQVGTKYFVKFYVVRSSYITATVSVQIAVNKIGAKFYTMPPSPPNSPTLNNFSHIFSNNIISDTLNWTEISGSFIADSNYQYVGFGNFFEDQYLGVNFFDSTGTHSYYYIDDVCISPDSLYCEQLLNLDDITGLTKLKIIPNPGNEQIFIKGTKFNKVFFYDIFGRLCYEYHNVSQETNINISNLLPGTYILNIESNRGNYFQKLIIYH